MGYLRTAREVAPHMIKAGWGRIINVSGLGARQTGSIIGSVRNVAVAALTKNLADELGPKGINVTVVHPGLTRTEKTPGVIAARAAAGGISAEEVEKRMAAPVILVGRLVDASEVADRRRLPRLAAQRVDQRRRRPLRRRRQGRHLLLT